MKQLIILIRIIAAIILISLGVDNLSKPSNLSVGIGVGEVILGLILVYSPIKSLFNKL